MRLVDLTIRNFRGFGAVSTRVPLGGDMVLLYGPNGFGKTSLSEAIEWLFYGYTRRRRRGDEYSKSEYEGSYANAHGGSRIEVKATVRFADGSEHVVERRGSPADDSLSHFYLDARPAIPADIGLRKDEPANPVIAQHDLQSFIHSRPKDRRDLISNALGLDAATAFKADLDAARRQFSANPPAQVDGARRKLQDLAHILQTIDVTRALGIRWLMTPPDVRLQDDTNTLIDAARSFASAETTDREAVLQALRVRRQQLSRSVFDDTVLRPTVDIPAARQRIGIEKDLLSQKTDTLARSIATCVATAATAYTNALLQFWADGLKIAPEGEQCPMCEAQTLQQEKRTVLENRLKDARAAMTANRDVISACNAANVAAIRAKQTCESTWLRDLPLEKRQALQQLFKDMADILGPFLRAHDATTAAQREGTLAFRELDTFLTAVADKLTDAKHASGASGEFTGAGKQRDSGHGGE